MLRNYPYYWWITEAEEVRCQGEWIKQQKDSGGMRKYLGSPDAPLVIVRGNHDFVDLGPLFDGEYFEVSHDSTRVVEYCGLKIGGFRGVPPIGGQWSDEYPRGEMKRIIDLVPEVDILVSHAAPTNILSDCFGSVSYFNWLEERSSQQKHLPKLCCFGHIHESGPQREDRFGVIFSNASCGFCVIDL